METELREMLRERAETVGPPAEVPPPVRRRAARRRWTNGSLATLTAVVVVAGSIVGVQAALGNRSSSQPIQQPTPSEEPTAGTTVVPPAPSAHVEFAIWPVVDGLGRASLQAGVTAGKDDWVTDPQAAAVRFAEDVMRWDPNQIVVKNHQENDTDATVTLWNQALGEFSPAIAETVSLTNVGGSRIWLVTRAATGLLDVQAPSLRQDTVEPTAPMEVSGTVTRPPAGWIVRTTMEYAASLLQPSEAETSNELTLDGPAFDLTLQPIAVYSDGPTLALRLFSGDGTLLGMWARRFVLDVAPPSPSRTAGADSGVFAAMLDAIRGSSSEGSRFALTPDRLDGDWTLDGNVDDDSGPGRLLVDVNVRAGMFEAHPCADPEFSQGVGCVERRLANGDLLVLRDVVDLDGNKTIDVALIHPDRSGVAAEAGNWTISGVLGGSPGSLEQITRPDPLYTVDELGRLVLAVDEKASRCIQAGC